MRRSTTFAGTEFSGTEFAGTRRPFLALVLLVELVAAVVLLTRATPATPATPAITAPSSTVVAPTPPAAATQHVALRDGRTAEILVLPGPGTTGLADRIRGDLDDAADAVTAFWGEDWRHDIAVVVTGTDEQFTAMGGGGSDIAAATTSERIVFAPGAAGMSDPSLRIVLRHELFHHAVRHVTAPDAPRWLTEGVADYVGRPPIPLPGPAAAADLALLPTDLDLDTPGAARSLAYDRAWWFSRFIADRYGPEGLRRLYLAACGVGHTDVADAVRDALGTELDEVLTAWRQWLSG
jgi:hypothetical protein